MSSHFVWLNRSKESIALDLKSEAGREAIGALVAKADVFVQNGRFNRNSLRVAHRGDLTTYIEGVFADPSADEVIDRLENAGFANARLRDMAGLTEHPQLVARRRWREFEAPVGTLQSLIPPATLDGDEPVMNPIPSPGEHTEAILAELGLAPELEPETSASHHEPEVQP